MNRIFATAFSLCVLLVVLLASLASDYASLGRGLHPGAAVTLSVITTLIASYCWRHLKD